MDEPLAKAGKTAVIPLKRNRKEQREYDKELYKARHLIENFFAKLKLYRSIPARYDKTTRSSSPQYTSPLLPLANLMTL